MPQNLQGKIIEDLQNRKVQEIRITHNRISDYTKNRMFVWYSSNTEINQKGSMMIYIVQAGDVKTFYISFVNINGWKINQTKTFMLPN